ncbi:MAG: hypothetical protein QNJ90_02340 [Planctomycetota bacterium]|nr:hypothetical protein [Planctomycetota bacterium]
MNARLLWIPVALLAAVAFVATEDAQASPLKAIQRYVPEGTQLGPRVYVGGRIGVPITSHRHRHGYYRRVVEYTGGYYVTRTREVVVRGDQIGWDFAGKPLYGPDRVEVQTYKEWVPRRRIVKRVWVPRRTRVHHHGYITVGGRVRIR